MPYDHVELNYQPDTTDSLPRALLNKGKAQQESFHAELSREIPPFLQQLCHNPNAAMTCGVTFRARGLLVEQV